ncbi:hypothetical protein [Ferrimicrobium sp.]|uniref:hypothetical protein n=1 Tax=Ferrimicrobium sp. TaxID=2926050 RepID=UPI0027E4A406|nr:hypothetical protein [Ferrimicrobium sp.]
MDNRSVPACAAVAPPSADQLGSRCQCSSMLARLVLARLVLARLVLARLVLARLVLARLVLARLVLARLDPLLSEGNAPGPRTA